MYVYFQKGSKKRKGSDDSYAQSDIPDEQWLSSTASPQINHSFPPKRKNALKKKKGFLFYII